MDTLSATIRLAQWLVAIRKAKHISQVSVIKGRFNDKFDIYSGHRHIGHCLFCSKTELFVDVVLYGFNKAIKHAKRKTKKKEVDSTFRVKHTKDGKTIIGCSRRY